MKEMKHTGKFTDSEWAELSSILSDEQKDNGDLLGRFMAEDSHNTIKYWKELRKMNNEKEINVDKAWDKLYSRLNENGMFDKKAVISRSITGTTWFRIAAAALILLGVGTGLFYLADSGIAGRKIVVETSENQKNLQVTLPDGSNIYLNRNTILSYQKNFGRNDRNVSLSGEAFFDIAPDTEKPFVVDAGMASIKVVGTSFNVISNNHDSAVEVYVKTGKVLLSGDTGNRNLEIEPGFVGTMDTRSSDSKVNNDPNYMSWNTGLLIYDGQTLDVVFRDLKRVYNMDIVADEPEILELPWTAPIINQPDETIIRVICNVFTLTYSKDGNVYHLSKK
jgi:transmembrane sensor